MKRIVICADGTWNEPEQIDEETGRRKPTNVLKVARAVLPTGNDDIEQVVYYKEGVGTNGLIDKFTGGAFGHGLADNVRSLYRFIVFNYSPGDEIFLFGFSRGAFTVRTLAGFMNAVGLLGKDDEFYTPEFYKLYEKGVNRNGPEWERLKEKIDNLRECPIIKYIGVWDTVGSLGAPGFLGRIFSRKKYKYHDIDLNKYIKNAYHALAIDERRRPFLPDIWNRPVGWGGELEQAWFAGVHLNVGGGYDPDGLANEPLHWLIEKSEKHGLHFDSEYLSYYWPCFNSVLRNSMQLKYWVLVPVTRKIGAHKEHGEFIHQSAIDRKGYKKAGYQPANLKDDLPVVNTSRIKRGEPCKEIV